MYCTAPLMGLGLKRCYSVRNVSSLAVRDKRSSIWTVNSHTQIIPQTMAFLTPKIDKMWPCQADKLPLSTCVPHHGSGHSSDGTHGSGAFDSRPRFWSSGFEHMSCWIHPHMTNMTNQLLPASLTGWLKDGVMQRPASPKSASDEQRKQETS